MVDGFAYHTRGCYNLSAHHQSKHRLTSSMISLLVHTLVFLSDDASRRGGSSECAKASRVSQAGRCTDCAEDAWSHVIRVCESDVPLDVCHIRVPRGLETQTLNSAHSQPSIISHV